jgi:sterol desaturase/sphingolipid hydroxylase (fatty acid hydroxylase superfamily)
MLDPFIRPAGAPTPLPPMVFGRVGMTLVLGTVITLVGHLYIMRFGFYGFLVHLVLCTVLTFQTLLSSNASGRNFVNLRKAGFSDLRIAAIYFSNMVSSQAIGFGIFNYVLTDSTIFSFSDVFSKFSFALLGKILINLTFAEVSFAFGHWLLHTVPALTQFHVFHHCCTEPDWNSNLLFDPIDLSIEFSGPAAGLLGMHYLLWQDQTALLITYLIFQLWYGYDHDLHLKTYHFYHHVNCDSLYAIYSNFKGNPRTNILKKKMFSMGLEWKKEGKKKFN